MKVYLLVKPEYGSVSILGVYLREHQANEDSKLYRGSYVLSYDVIT